MLRASAALSPVIDRARAEQPSIGERGVAEDLLQLRDSLNAAGRPPVRLLVIDTVRASLFGSEDDSDNAAAYIRVVRRLAAIVPTAATVMLFHSGWQDGQASRQRERGSSAWRGNVDATAYLTPVHVVAARLGHSKVEMTLNVYAHALPDQQQAAAASLGALLHG